MYTIAKIADRAAFDRLIEDGGFDLRLSAQPWGGEPMDVRACLRHDGTAFHVAMRCYEAAPLATVAEHEGDVHLDSCLEFFFSPCPDLRPDYFNMEANPAGSMKFNYGPGRHGRIKTHKLPDLAGMAAAAGEGWWQLSYSIPFSLVREFAPEFSGASGSLIRANLYRCGELAAQDQYVMLYPPPPGLVPAPDYHRPEYFGEMRLG